MGVLNLAFTDLLNDIADAFDEDAIDANSHHSLTRVTRVTNRVLKQLGRAYPMRMEEFVYTSDGTTELQPWPSDFLSVQEILINDIPQVRTTFNERIWSHPFLYWQDALILGNYIRPDGVGMYPVPANGATIKLIVRASLPKVLSTSIAITDATWTNDSTDPVSSSDVTLVNPAITADVDGAAILGPDGLVYTIKSRNTAGTTVTLTEPFRGTGVTGVSGAATIGGHIPLFSWWTDALLYKIVYELMKSEPDESRTPLYLNDWNDARDEAISTSEQLFGERITRQPDRF